MAAIRILKVLSPEFYDKEYEDSGINRFTVRCDHEPSRGELRDIGLWRYHCSCGYDCCGHVQYGAPRVERRNKRNEWYVTQHFYRNV